jgi:ketosteroid isomerase-like protein
MKQILLVVLLTILSAIPTLAQAESKPAPPERSVEGQLIEFERQLSDALVREDAAVLDRLWSNDLVFTFPDGKVSNKAQRLAGQKPTAQPSPSESETTNDEVKVHLYGNTAVVTVLSTWKGKANNQAYSSQFQATHVWVKQAGRWQLVAAHVSPVKK